jgi:hypothetical protein
MKHLLLLAIAVGFILPHPYQSRAFAASEGLTATGKRAKVVGKAALYGTGGGLVVGLASQVFKRKTKNIFVFGSLGLYAGIILGIYVVSTSSEPTPYEGPDTYEDYGDFSRLKPENKMGHTFSDLALAQKPSVQVNFLNLNF